MAGLKLELDERAKQKLMEYLGIPCREDFPQVPARRLRVGDESSFCILSLISLLIFPHIKILHSFRDAYLMTHGPGREIVRCNYSCSPVMDDYISKLDELVKKSDFARSASNFRIHDSSG